MVTADMARLMVPSGPKFRRAICPHLLDPRADRPHRADTVRANMAAALRSTVVAPSMAAAPSTAVVPNTAAHLNPSTAVLPSTAAHLRPPSTVMALHLRLSQRPMGTATNKAMRASQRMRRHTSPAQAVIISRVCRNTINPDTIRLLKGAAILGLDMPVQEARRSITRVTASTRRVGINREDITRAKGNGEGSIRADTDKRRKLFGFRITIG